MLVLLQRPQRSLLHFHALWLSRGAKPPFALLPCGKEGNAGSSSEAASGACFISTRYDSRGGAKPPFALLPCGKEGNAGSSSEAASGACFISTRYGSRGGQSPPMPSRLAAKKAMLVLLQRPQAELASFPRAMTLEGGRSPSVPPRQCISCAAHSAAGSGTERSECPRAGSGWGSTPTLFPPSLPGGGRGEGMQETEAGSAPLLLK